MRDQASARRLAENRRIATDAAARELLKQLTELRAYAPLDPEEEALVALLRNRFQGAHPERRQPVPVRPAIGRLRYLSIVFGVDMNREEAKAKILAEYDDSLDLKSLDWNDGFDDCWIVITSEVRSVIEQLDSLAEVWGDEGVFRRCRDRLKDAVGVAR